MSNLSDQQIESAYKSAPGPVRALLDSDALPQIISAMGAEFRLHIDVIGKVAENIRNLLIGLISPTQFLGELLAGGMAEPQARQIMGEVNEKIFKPLQEEMRRNAPSEEALPATSPPPPRYAPPAPPAPPPQPTPVVQPAAPPPLRAPSAPPPVAATPPPPPREWAVPQTAVGPEQGRGAPHHLDMAAVVAYQPHAAAPLPPRGVMPGASAPRFVKPMQAPAWESAPQQPIPPSPALVRGIPPSNLPTQAPPAAPQAAQGAPTAPYPPTIHEPEPAAVLPPLTKPSSTPPAPRPPYAADPYREPIE